ncbi:uncharacterized protein VTP21DRAFT_3410 [Calcarisporiella thermophila]|uniref:uncharacterized protein n=1 Tax=Calcarisporiella thermophila TaxID=911321 RepID=UPI0037420F77
MASHKQSEATSVLHAQAQQEQVYEEIHRDRQMKIALDKKRQKNREAINALKKSEEDSTWLDVGGFFIQLPKEKTESIIRNNQKEIEEGIAQIETNIKHKVRFLDQLQQTNRTSVYDLNPVKKEELLKIPSL